MRQLLSGFGIILAPFLDYCGSWLIPMPMFVTASYSGLSRHNDLDAIARADSPDDR